ncbi:AlpA family phage regulatory protein [Novosphingobium sp. NBM11]|uniref:helix-turn-helix transcriptional regulator n=1 Tax=Novosphingobium sp. NBM11 TaxID=2596914 RepID=UPI0018926ACA|nr:AlpA family phage regulatory protein [Novosphingobium sp. NBM11]MBF5091957.1 AlpA family phage regulatory protein [Novosphingobium sp. NBM11]
MTDRYMRLPEVIAITTLSESTIRRREREGAFPKRVRLGPAAVVWRESDINRWIAEMAERSASA